MPNAIEFTTGLDLAPLQRDWSRAEAIGKNGAARVQGVINRVNSVPINWGVVARQRQQSMAFFEQGGPRTARNFLPAPKGKYLSPSDQLAEEASGNSRRIRGLGAGLTVVAGIHQLASAYLEAAENAYKLRTENDKLLRPIGGTTGLDELRQRITAIAQAGDDAAKQRSIDNQSLFSQAVAGGRTLLNWAAGFGSPAEQGKQEASDKSGRNKRATEALQLMAERQREINAAEREGLDGSERKSAIMKAQIAHRERLADLAEREAAAGVNNPAARNAENERFDIDLAQINRRTARREAHRVFRQSPSNPSAYFRNPAAYTRHPDAYTGVPEMSGMDWFRKHPRDFGLQNVNRLRNTDQEFYSKWGTGGMLAGGASMTKPKTIDGIVRGTGDIDGKAIVAAIKELIGKFTEAWQQ